MRIFRHVSRIIAGSTLAFCLFSGTVLAANLGDRLLTVGARGDDVYQLQQELQAKGYFDATPTGYYGDVTRQAVRDFQSAAGIGIDGIAGPQTVGKLDVKADDQSRSHTTVAGDNLWSLARRYGTTVSAFKSLNGLAGDTIYVGQRLQVPEAAKVGTTPTEQQKTTSSRGASVNREDLLLLARLIEAEAGGESYNGKLAVGAVVVNRINSADFPNDLKGVIYQKNQFSPVSDGRIWSVTVSSDSQKAAEQALTGTDPTAGATFFFNPTKTSSRFMHSRPVITQIGGHVFAR